MSSPTERDWMAAPVGHEDRVEGLWRAAREGRLAHALGFFGPRGVGKYMAARWFAGGMFCADTTSPRPGAPCGTCGPCSRIRAGTHPDVYVLDPDALGLNIVRVQDVVHRDDSDRPTLDEFLALKAGEGGYRVVILRDFDRANPQAQNALLKTLEEPGPGVVLVVESSAPAKLVGTVKSRLVDVVFERLDRTSTSRALETAGLDDETARRLSRISRGAPGRALELERLCAHPMLELIERALRGEDAVVLLSELASLEGEFPGRQPSEKNRARARFFLDLILEVCTDLLRAASGVDAKSLAHGALATAFSVNESFAGAAAAAPRAPLRQAVDLCLDARQDVDMNLSPDAACERALLALARVAERAHS